MLQIQSGGSWEDFDDQDTAKPYVYDKIGNLISDEIEGIEQIAWDVDGKIRGITFDPNGDLRPSQCQRLVGAIEIHHK
ncbi:MAG: hypothetical protein AAFP89_25720 [Bacteroidota bacterium]